jgi:hypothetical protein
MHPEATPVQKVTKLRKLIVLGTAVLALSLSACRQAEPTPSARETNLTFFAGEGRDRLCLAENGGPAGFITFAEGSDANCTVRGSWSPSGPQAIKPNGDQSCSFVFNKDERSITLIGGGPGCAYYCGPGATFANKTFVRTDKPEPVTDVAGDPLC